MTGTVVIMSTYRERQLLRSLVGVIMKTTLEFFKKLKRQVALRPQ